MQKEGMIRYGSNVYEYLIRTEKEQVEKLTKPGRLRELKVSTEGRLKVWILDGAVRVFPHTGEEMAVVASILSAYEENPEDPDVPEESNR